jgi:hypothetical protein
VFQTSTRSTTCSEVSCISLQYGGVGHRLMLLRRRFTNVRYDLLSHSWRPYFSFHHPSVVPDRYFLYTHLLRVCCHILPGKCQRIKGIASLSILSNSATDCNIFQRLGISTLIVFCTFLPLMFFVHRRYLTVITILSLLRITLWSDHYSGVRRVRTIPIRE